jgi:hypothetical protein
MALGSLQLNMQLKILQKSNKGLFLRANIQAAFEASRWQRFMGL